MKNVIINTEDRIGKVSETVKDVLGILITFDDKDGYEISNNEIFGDYCSRKPYSNELIFFEFVKLKDIIRKFKDTYGISAVILGSDFNPADEELSLDKYIELNGELPEIEELGTAPAPPIVKQEELSGEHDAKVLKEIEAKERSAFSFTNYIEIAETAAKKLSSLDKARELYTIAADKILILSDYKKLLDSMLANIDEHEFILEFAEKARGKAILKSDIEFLDEYIDLLIAKKVQDEEEADGIDSGRELAVEETPLPDKELPEDDNVIIETDKTPEEFHHSEIGAEPVEEVIPDQVRPTPVDEPEEIESEIIDEQVVTEPEPEDIPQEEEIEVEEVEAIPLDGRQEQEPDIEEAAEAEVIEIEEEEVIETPVAEDTINFSEKESSGSTEFFSETTETYQTKFEFSDGNVTVSEESFTKSTGEPFSEIPEGLSFDEYRHKAAAAFLKDKNKALARRYFKKAESKLIYIDDYIALAASIMTTIKDSSWASNLCKTAEGRAVTLDEYIKIAEFLFTVLNHEKWARKVIGKAEAEADDFDDYNKLGEFVSHVILDKTLAGRLFQMAVTLSRNNPKSGTQSSTKANSRPVKSHQTKYQRNKAPAKNKGYIFYIIVVIIVIIATKMCD